MKLLHYYLKKLYVTVCCGTEHTDTKKDFFNVEEKTHIYAHMTNASITAIH